MVTAEKIIEYVLYTPYNPNRAVLLGLLESYLKDNGGGTLDEKVLIIPNEKGETLISPLEPEPNEDVTIVPVPKIGFDVSNVIVVDVKGNIVAVTDNGDGTYSYTQPADRVSAVIVVDYDTEGIDPDDVIVYDGGAPSGWA